MKINTILSTLALSVVAISSAHAYDPKATIADLDARLAKIGAPKLEGTEKVADKDVPALFFGERKINNNYDVVDAVRKAHNATATVFVKQGDEFVRVSTNVLTPEGKRGIGTQLGAKGAAPVTDVDGRARAAAPRRVNFVQDRGLVRRHREAQGDTP